MVHSLRRALVISGPALALVLVGCGGGPSFSSISTDLKTPTGTVDATSAKAVGAKIEEQGATGGLPLGGEREDLRSRAQAASATIACSAGGTASATGDGDQNRGHSHVQYNNCCEADCCFNGSGDFFYDSSSDDFSMCMDYGLSFSCTSAATGTSVSTSGNVDLSACMSLSGDALGLVYLIEVEGMTYRVTGTVSSGSGSLTITGENGSYSCTYTSGAGTCTGTGTTSGSFTF